MHFSHMNFAMAHISSLSKKNNFVYVYIDIKVVKGEILTLDTAFYLEVV